MSADFPIAGVVHVDITRETLFPSRDGFGTLLIVGTDTVIGSGERVRFYSSIEDVEDDFATTDEEHIAATAYFSQAPRPTRLAIGRALAADTQGYLEGGASGSYALFSAMSTGSLRISVDAETVDVTGMDFTLAGDMNDVATEIETEINLQLVTAGVSVTHDGEKFTITSALTGDTSRVLPLEVHSSGSGSDISGAAYINARAGVAAVYAGHTYTDFAGELSAIQEANDDWYGLAFTRDLNTSQNYQDAAEWTEARTKLLGAFSSEVGALSAVSTTDLPYLLQLSTYHRTHCWWHEDPTEYPEVSFFGRMLTVDFTVPNSASTGKFKQLPGVATVQITTSQLTALKGKNCNTYVLRGGVPMTEEGMMASGEFFDVMHFVDWLENAIAVDVFGALYTAARKIPYTDEGAAVLEDQVRGALDQGVAAGGIAEDFDDDGNLQPAYTLETTPVLDVPQSQRAQRQGPPITFEARFAGAIHFATVAGVVTV